MVLDGNHQITRTAVMQEEQSLTQAPERRGAKFVRTRSPLDNVISHSRAHVMHQQIRKEVNGLASQSHYVRPISSAGRVGFATPRVWNDCVWQSAQPTWLNSSLPCCALAVSGAGCGASTKRMNSVNISHAGMIFSGLL